MFWTGVTSKIEEKSEFEDLKDGKWRLTAWSGEEDTKTFLVPDDIDTVTEGRCRGILKISASKMVGSDMEFCTSRHVTDTDVEVRALYNWDSVGDMGAPVGKLDKVWMDERSNVEDKELETK